MAIVWGLVGSIPRGRLRCACVHRSVPPSAYARLLAPRAQRIGLTRRMEPFFSALSLRPPQCRLQPAKSAPDRAVGHTPQDAR